MARTEKWQRKYPTARQKCQVCGTEFSPAETASARRMKWERDELRKALGEERFLKLAREYLVAMGESPETAESIVIETEAQEKRRAEKHRHEAELRALKDRYLSAHVFAGLKTVPPPPSDVEGDEDEEPQTASIPWFDADSLAEAIRRAVAGGISITYMTHHSTSGEMDRSQWRELTEPLAVLATWKEEGCSEKFSAGFRVPDALVQG